MPRTCTVCRLPAESRQKTNQALLAGEPYRDIAKRTETSTAALVRHKAAHLDGLRRKAVKVEEAHELAAAESLVDKLERYELDALRLAKKAEEAGDLRTASSILTTGVTRFAELTARLRGELQAAGANVQVNLLAMDPEIRRFLESPGAKAILESEMRMRAMSPERVNEFLWKYKAREYVHDPAGFLDRLRSRAAQMLSEEGRIPLAEARRGLEALETKEAGNGEG